MTLIQQQLIAVKETLAYVKEEYRVGKNFHHWSPKVCPLCKSFYMGNSYGTYCAYCPIAEATGIELAKEFNCQDIGAECWGVPSLISLEDIAGFLKSLEVYLEEKL